MFHVKHLYVFAGMQEKGASCIPHRMRRAGRAFRAFIHALLMPVCFAFGGVLYGFKNFATFSMASACLG